VTGILLIAGLLLLAFAAIIAYPLVFHRVESYLPEGAIHDQSEGFIERDALLEAMSDLEQASLTGKLSPEDYNLQKAELEQRYFELLHAEEGGVA